MIDYDVVVVGSGFGGAVNAARLAQRGMKVLVLERGPWWGPSAKEKPKKEGRPFPRGVRLPKLLRNIRQSVTAKGTDTLLNPDGLFEVTQFPSLTMIQSSGVGGGSLVYTSIMAEPPEDFFDAFPEEITNAEMASYFARVRKMLQPKPAPRPPTKTQAFEKVLQDCGFHKPFHPDLAIAWPQEGQKKDQPFQNPSGVTQKICRGDGACILGCENDSKLSLDRTYLPLALRHGAKVFAMCEVTSISTSGKNYRVRWRNHLNGRDGEVYAPRVVLAAGGLNTQRLLFDARDTHRGLPRISMALGSRFSPNGDVVALVLDSPKVKKSAQGPAFAAYLPLKKDGQFHYLIGEVGMPLKALPIPQGLKFLEQTVILLSMGRDNASGKITFDGSHLHTDLSREMDPAYFHLVEKTIEQIAAGYRPKGFWLNAPWGRGGKKMSCVSPLGGAPMGRTQKEGVVDHVGEVFGHPGLFVADASIFPAPPGTAPSMTIAALAERQAELMV